IFTQISICVIYRLLVPILVIRSFTCVQIIAIITFILECTHSLANNYSPFFVLLIPITILVPIKYSKRTYDLQRFSLVYCILFWS
ncbi:hypothetical protein L9F63_004094, partial [Diploptera punctata]